MTAMILYAGTFGIVTLVAWYTLRAIQDFTRLRAFGGHWLAGWSRLWLLKTQTGGEMNRKFTEINDKHGPTARVGPHMLVTTDPQLVRRMNAIYSPFVRGDWYAALRLHPERDNILSYVDEKKHADIRRRMAPGYSGKFNVHLEEDVDEKLLMMLELIQTNYLTTPSKGRFRVMDISRVTSFFTLDVISKIAFGQSFGFLDADDDHFGYLENLRSMLPVVLTFSVYSGLIKILKAPLVQHFLPKLTDKRGLGRVMHFAKSRVQERFGPKAVERQDMLNSFINHGLSSGELESETLTQITAGSDSTASSLRIALHFISTSPPILDRLLVEARVGIDAGRITRPIIKDMEARKLPYLQACIKEALRMYPPVTGLLPKTVPSCGMQIGVNGIEKFVPGGTQVGWNPWGMMRTRAIFGEDCEIFRPERWLTKDYSDNEQHRVRRMNDTVQLCFGYGRFGCLGRGIATMELNKAILEVLLRFNLQPCSLAKPFTERAIGFYIHDDMNFVATLRHGKIEDRDLEMPGMDAGALPGAFEA